MHAEYFDRFVRIKAVEREYSASRLASDRLLAAIEQDPTVLGHSRDIRVRDVRDASERLEGTYLIRLFAEFESAIRAFWSRARNSDAPTRTRDLLDGVAATCRIQNERIANAHSVRLYRNSLVHERGEPAEPISISQSRRYLCEFFSYLSRYWRAAQ
jgi:hypothetical protein